jgi:hypothetical protein
LELSCGEAVPADPLSGELAQIGILAVALASLAMLIYIWIGSNGRSR